MSDMSSSTSILGVVLAGGRSKRMGEDKASLLWDEKPLWRRQAELLREAGLETAISIRPDQELPGMADGEFELIPDAYEDAGPLAGFLSAWAKHADHAILAIACDLPLLDLRTVEHLLAQRNPECFATAYISANDGLPEPLCAIYEPTARAMMEDSLAADRRCPRKILIQGGEQVQLIELPHPNALENANTPEELARLRELKEEASA